MITETFTAITALVDVVRLWGEKKNDDEQALRTKKEAIRLVMDAVIATKAYLYETTQGTEPAREQERNLSRKWQDAANAIRDYDLSLYQSAQFKALGWADPREWKRAELRPWVIKLYLIINQCAWLLEND